MYVKYYKYYITAKCLKKMLYIIYSIIKITHSWILSYFY